MNNCTKPIGVFDSGIGGITVLSELVKKMPNEDFLYFGDSYNAPYGMKTEEDICKLALDNTRFLLSKGAKAVVIACNTATSVAAKTIRMLYPEIPVIGVEPAIKPAALHKKNSNILVMATPVTLKNDKFCRLMEMYKGDAKIYPKPCPGLVEIIEKGQVSGSELDSFLEKLLLPYRDIQIDSVVLGCTHYVFIKKSILRALGKNILIFDGGIGTASETYRRIFEKGLLNNHKNAGRVTFYNSNNSEEKLKLMERLLNYQEDN